MEKLGNDGMENEDYKAAVEASNCHFGLETPNALISSTQTRAERDDGQFLHEDDRNHGSLGVRSITIGSILQLPLEAVDILFLVSHCPSLCCLHRLILPLSEIHKNYLVRLTV